VSVRNTYVVNNFRKKNANDLIATLEFDLFTAHLQVDHWRLDRREESK